MGFIWGVPGLGLLENGLPLMMRSVDEEVAAKLDIQASLAKGAMMSLISIFEQETECCVLVGNKKEWQPSWIYPEV